MKLEICLTGFSHDEVTWPQCKIEIDGQVYFDQTVKEYQHIVLMVDIMPASLHNLKIYQYGKMFGENRVWHTKVSNEKVVSDRYIVLNDILFDDVSIKQIWHNGHIENQFNNKQIEDFNKHSVVVPFAEQIPTGYNEIRISYNGGFVLDFESPVYNWIILKKFPLMKIHGKLKESSLTSIASWRVDYTNGNALEGLFNECMELLGKVK